MFAMGISIPQFIGSINLSNYQTEADLRQSLGRLGLTAAQQNQVVAGVANNLSLFILSGVSIPNNVAKGFGAEFHDGEMPNEPNDIQFVRTSAAGAVPMTVNITLNSQIMPAPVRGNFQWGKVEDCLLGAGVFTQAQVDAIRNQIQTTGSNSSNWRGVSTAVINCLGQ